MTIDIIAFTDEQYSALTANQLQEVTSAQARKDRMTSALAEKKRKEILLFKQHYHLILKKKKMK